MVWLLLNPVEVTLPWSQRFFMNENGFGAKRLKRVAKRRGRKKPMVTFNCTWISLPYKRQGQIQENLWDQLSCIHYIYLFEVFIEYSSKNTYLYISMFNIIYLVKK